MTLANDLINLDMSPELANVLAAAIPGFDSGFTFSENYTIKADTTDGSDNLGLFLASGGAASASRGAFLALYGNEYTSTGSYVTLSTGNAASSILTLDSAGSSGTIVFKKAGTAIWTMNGANLYANVAGPIICTDTADASDNDVLTLCGGGGGTPSRGAVVVLRGNEQSGGNGGLELVSGSVTGGYLYFSALGSSSSIQMLTNSLERWRVNASGDMVQESTNGGNITMTKASTCLRQLQATGLTAAGTSISDALDLTAVYNDVTTVAASSGVQLWAVPAGGFIVVSNRGANALSVYPSAADGTINGGSAGAAVSVAATEVAFFFSLGGDDFIGGVMVTF